MNIWCYWKKRRSVTIRKIGKEMQLFMFSETVGKGLPMWLPKGTALRLRLQEFLRRIQTRYDYRR